MSAANIPSIDIFALIRGSNYTSTVALKLCIELTGTGSERRRMILNTAEEVE